MYLLKQSEKNVAPIGQLFSFFDSRERVAQNDEGKGHYSTGLQVGTNLSPY